ncbi:hypothetical protein PR202_gb24554 [Eleusine coracana subsp. coracana]|uniref:NFACT RNA-binding domain-containing protein n=1 Tax=Eleusine coracana subsp. coracana TaxID=191504 RepID=A0AAV5FLX9_ELECO|nr:hypothetical protein PR202_gb24554 [Eleusine coracana subsp. coracana]
MVFYFKARPEAGDYTIFMGLDKHENEDLIKYGFPEDICPGIVQLCSFTLRLSAKIITILRFHVDKMSSAHVYVRLNKGQTMDDISEVLSFAKVRTVKVEKRINEIVNRLNKTKVERKADLKAEREAVSAAEKAERKAQLRDKKRKEEMERLEKEKQAEIRSYKGLMVQEKMTSNKQIASGSKTVQELEEDFM